ncbi:MAG TPA: hypothetical protein VLG76_02990 [Rhabdochlamydiaceae bacterium]|nr:hypothetical protein [Rhabdochlamydiaceae bacterium]
MLTWVVIIGVLCLILGIIGHTGKPEGPRQIARVFFFLLLVLFLVGLGYYVFQNYFHPQVDLNLKMPSGSDLLPNPFKSS